MLALCSLDLYRRSLDLIDNEKAHYNFRWVSIYNVSVSCCRAITLLLQAIPNASQNSNLALSTLAVLSLLIQFHSYRFLMRLFIQTYHSMVSMSTRGGSRSKDATAKLATITSIAPTFLAASSVLCHLVALAVLVFAGFKEHFTNVFEGYQLDLGIIMSIASAVLSVL